MKNVIFTYDTIQNGERGEACAMILSAGAASTSAAAVTLRTALRAWK